MGEFTTSIGTNVGFGSVEPLVARLKEGDEQAFSEVFQLHKDLVYTLSCKLLADKGEAMDVTQEVFLTLYRKIDKFRGECSLKTWLYRVTLNQAANRNRWWKRRFRERTLSLSLETNDNKTPLELPGEQPSPHRLVLSEELRRAIHQGLGQLPFDQRSVVVLRDVEGLSYEEIAEVTGAQVGTVKSRLARGRERLREILRAYQPGSAL